MIRLLLAILFALNAAPAVAQDITEIPAPTPAEVWTRANERLRFTPAGVTLPNRAGVITVTEVGEFSHQGEHIDNFIQYRSADGEVIGTVYIYYPAVAHVGLAAFATNHAIRLSSSSEVSSRGSTVVAAGDSPRAALRSNYGNYRNGHASSATFIKVGRWMIKLRVSGPERRRDEAEAAMTALLSGIGFEAGPPREAAPLQIEPCGTSPTRPARMLPADAEAAGWAIAVASFDGGGNSATGPRGEAMVMPPRLPSRWCLSTRARIGQGIYPILRAMPGQQGGLEGRSRLVVIISDSGGLLEVVELRNERRFGLLYHQIGETAVLRSYDDVPSDEQIADIIGGDLSGGSAIARMQLCPGQVDHVELLGPQQPTTPEPVT